MRQRPGLILLAALLGLFGCDEPLHFDDRGFPHGTGERVYHYDAGPVMLREHYVDGTLEHSRWYAPDGTLIAETDWIDQSGEGIYLRQDGSIRRRMTFVNGIAEGPATDYDEQGNVIKVVEYSDGQPVEQ